MPNKLSRNYKVTSTSTFKEGTVVVLQKRTKGGVGYKAKAFFDRKGSKNTSTYGRLDHGDMMLTTVYGTKRCAGKATYVSGKNGIGYCVRKVAWEDIKAFKRRLNPVLKKTKTERVRAGANTRKQFAGVCQIDGQYFGRSFIKPLTVRTKRVVEAQRYDAAQVKALEKVDPSKCYAAYTSYRLTVGKSHIDWLFDMGSAIYRQHDLLLAPLFKAFGLVNSADFVDAQSVDGGTDMHHFDVHK